ASTNLFKTFDTIKNQISNAIDEAFAEIRNLPIGYQETKDYLSKKENREIALSFCIKIFIALFVGFVAWMVSRRYIKKLEGKLRTKGTLNLSRKIGIVLVSTVLKITLWIGLYFFSYLFFLLFPVHVRIEFIILHAILAFIIYFTSKNLIYFMASPEEMEWRVVPLKDEWAGYIFIWCRRILLFSLWMYLLIMPGTAFDKPILVKTFSVIYKMGIVLMLATLLAQWKQNIEKLLSLKFREEDAPVMTRWKRTFNFLMGKLYLIIILYLGIIVILSIMGYSNIFSYLLGSTLKSVFILLIALGLWVLWDYLFKKLFQVGRSIKQKFPELEEKVNRYTNLLKKGVYALILLFSGMTIMDVWGLGIYEYLNSNVPIVRAAVRIPVIVIMAFLLVQITYYFIGKMEKQTTRQMLASRKSSIGEIEKRVSTLGKLFRKAAFITAVVVTIMMVLPEFGFDIKPILAGAGILGLAVGFGAQTLVKDIISGLFLTFENRIRAGDVAVINGTGGLVEQVNLRTTVLRSQDGTVHVFPNGSISTLSNMTHGFSFYVFNVGVAYKEDTDKVAAVLKQVGDEIMQDEDYKPFILEPIEILGVDQFADSAVVIKARIKTMPIKQWFVGREMNRRIKKRFDEEGIEIPFPHQTFYFGEDSKPISVKLEGMETHKEEIKKWIHDALKENGIGEGSKAG
ncbi:MAG: mechanosensitive ion channel domain-containing protein, partial [Planctomycetota bacterium]